jgi:hypothetical protein
LRTSLFTPQFVAAIPPDILSALVRREEFSQLDRRVPFFAAAIREVAATAALRSEVASARAGIGRLSVVVPALRAEGERIEIACGKMRERNRVAEETFARARTALAREPLCDLHMCFAPLREKVVSTRAIVDLQDKLRRAVEETKTGNRLAEHMRVMLPERRAEWKRNLEEWGQELALLSECFGRIQSTDDIAAKVDCGLFLAFSVAQAAEKQIADDDVL